MTQILIKKAEAKLQIVYAEVYAPLRPDAHNDFATEDVIRKAAWDFMRNLRQDQVDHQHTNELVDSACIVESFIAREGDPLFIPGAWVVGIHIPNPEEWAKVENGTWNGLSMEAWLKKTEVEIEVDLPPVIYGTTAEPVFGGDTYDPEDDHTHRIQVAYNEEGTFLGGRTEPHPVDGHWHRIYAGTITEVSQGHFHRFMHLDDFQISE